MSHIHMIHVTHLSKAMSHIYTGQVLHRYESCHTNMTTRTTDEMSHVTHLSESCLTYTQVASHIYMSLKYVGVMWQGVEHIYESCHRLFHICMIQITGRLTYMCVMSHTYSSHFTYIWVTSQGVSHIYASCHRFFHICMSHVTGRSTYTGVMSHVSHVYASCHRDMTTRATDKIGHVTHLSKSCLTYIQVTSHTYMSHVTGTWRLEQQTR